MDRLVLLDSNSILNRAYYAMPKLTNRGNMHTGGIYGFMQMYLRALELFKPSHIVAVFDRKAPTFRKEMYDQYKAQRHAMPPELAEQFEPLKNLLKAMEVTILEKDGYEADDIIGTIAKKYDCETIIITSDRDSLQLIDDTTNVVLTKKGVTEVERYDLKKLAEDGFTPSQIIDYKALRGDTADNIPGVHGIGEVTAKNLLDKYKNLDNVYAHVEEEKDTLKQKLIDGKEMAYLSYKLATIDVNVPIECDFEKFKVVKEYNEEVRDILFSLAFAKIADKLEYKGVSLKTSEKKKEIIKIDNIDALREAIKMEGNFCLDMQKQISISQNNKNYEVVICDNLFGIGINYNEFVGVLKNVLSSPSIRLVAYDVKTLMHVLDLQDIQITCKFDDIMIKAYLCDAPRSYKDVETLLISYGLSTENIASNFLEIEKYLDKTMKEKNIVSLYEEIEHPLIKILYDMEKTGFRVNEEKMNLVSKELSDEIINLNKEIYTLADEVFNINSSKQLATILFEKLKLKPTKKNKTGFSTSAEVLEELKNSHPIVEKILRYREITKLQSTYLVGMKPLIEDDGKIHTVFKQAVTSTGRLSSTEPNLQNIPVRKPEGAKIRSMFIASENNKLVIADYSQIELRVLAHLSGDKALIDGFNSGIDVHTLTASKAYGLPVELITKQMRSSAKTINFGIIYGMSDFGLASDLGVPVYKAKEFITKYFEAYPRVKEYLDECIVNGKEKGYVTTLMGRRRDIPELKSSSHTERNYGERISMNMPMQGSASDIVKKAMIDVFNALKEEKLKAKMIMQVHDELVIDTPLEEIERVKAILKQKMENVTMLSVNLNVDIGVGDNWLEAK